MAKLYRKSYPIPMPQGAEIVTRRGGKFAQWTDGYGNLKSAPLSADGKKIMHEAEYWYARYRDADGTEKRISTNCRDEQAARQVLANIVAKVEKVKSGIITQEESQAADHAHRPIEDHFADYLEYLAMKTVRGRRVAQSHLYNVKLQLDSLAKECDFKCIIDITRQRMTRWIKEQGELSDKASRTVMKYRSSLMSFCKWAVRECRLASNPLTNLPGVEMAGAKSYRRPLNVQEIEELLKATTARPLRDATLIRRGRNIGQEKARLKPEFSQQLRRLGRERALIYKTLIYTGLRKNELATLRIADLHLDDQRPHLSLAAKNAKNARSAQIPLRADLVKDLRWHIDDLMTEHQRRSMKIGQPATPLAPDTKLFRVPHGLVRIFDRDIAAAGIAKTDADGRKVDVHSLRYTFTTLLSRSGVMPRMAQELMRHSDIRLTMNTYTHLQLIDTASAIETLPGVDLNNIGIDAKKTAVAG